MFIGREKELKELTNLYHQNKPTCIVCTGRRRIGKSTLIEEFSKKVPNFYEFQGLHPVEGKTERDQLDHFANRIKIIFKKPIMKFSSWLEAFNELNQLIGKKRALLFLDEISWMSTGSKTFSAQLKDAWDTLFKKNPHLMLVIAGSVSSWITENILENTNFLGRVSWHIALEELPLEVLKEFWKNRKNFISNYDFFKTISVLGGIPRYLEEINENESPEQNIYRLCFNKNGFLLYEFDKIFSDIFSRRGPIYKRIVSQLIQGPLSMTEVAKQIRVEKSGSISRYLDDLVKSGFLSADTTYNLSGKPKKFVKFRIKDNYLRFALKYLEPLKKRIIDNSFTFTNLESLSSWHTIVGLQFENTILNNKELIIRHLNIDPTSVISASPHFQPKTSKNKGGCQIDLMIVTKNFQIYICEIKFAAKITSQVLHEMNYKIKVLKRPRHYTIHPVLIYGGELQPVITRSNIFQCLSIDDLV